MTDLEIAQELERVFALMPGMRRCFETWQGIGSGWGVVLTEAEFNRRFYELLCRTERRAQEHRARALADLAAAGLLIPGVAQIHIPLQPDTKRPGGASIITSASPSDRKPPQSISKKVAPSTTRPAPERTLGTVWMPKE